MINENNLLFLSCPTHIRQRIKKGQMYRTPLSTGHYNLGYVY